MSKKKKNVPTSKIVRMGKLFGATSYIVAKELSGRIKEKVKKQSIVQKLEQKQKQAAQIVKTLSELRGAALKAGQMLSLELSDFLPPEVTKILNKMHDQVYFMDIDKVEKILHNELGDDGRALLKNFDEEPFAAASIGQVHKATYKGQNIVIKIQYPKIGKSIKSDIQSIEKLITVFMKGTGKKIDFGDIYKELESNFRKEIDYKKEAAALIKYKDLFKEHKYFTVPSPIIEISSKRILAMEEMQGIKLTEYIESKKYDPVFFGNAILKLLFLEFFEFGIVQTDPNPGNFLVDPKRKKLILLDLGSHKKYSKKTRKNVTELLKVTLAGDKDAIINKAYQLELLEAHEEPEVKELFFKMMRQITMIFDPQHQPFNFSDENYLADIRRLSLEFVRAVKYSKPSKELIFLNRKLGGMFHILKQGNIEMNVSDYWDKIDQANMNKSP